ncbi:MAG: hypothetical protein HQM09_21090 [Candidatus Riflebacteria bacterium]|nr:hypothetical protein [Candidatus Riflebacteria bacterium]
MLVHIPGLDPFHATPISGLITGILVGLAFGLVFWLIAKNSLRSAHAKDIAFRDAQIHDLDESRNKLEAKNKALTVTLEDSKKSLDLLDGRLKAEVARNTASEEKITQITQAERDASGKADSLQKEIKRANEEMDRMRRTIDDLRDKERQFADLKISNKQTLQEKETLENKKRDLEQNVALLESRATDQEKRLEETTARLQTKTAECEKVAAELEKVGSERINLSNRLLDEMFKRSLAEERLFKVGVLERENAELRAENLELKMRCEKITYHDKQLDEIKSLHEDAFDEGNVRRQEQFANRLFDMKRGLERAVEAYNHTVGLLDQRFTLLGGATLSSPQAQQPILVGLKTEDAIQIESQEEPDEGFVCETAHQQDVSPEKMAGNAEAEHTSETLQEKPIIASPPDFDSCDISESSD